MQPCSSPLAANQIRAAPPTGAKVVDLVEEGNWGNLSPCALERTPPADRGAVATEGLYLQRGTARMVVRPPLACASCREDLLAVV